MAEGSSNGNGHFPANLPVLDGKNWEKWCVKMGVIFGFQDVTDLVKNGIPEEVEGATDAQTAAHKAMKKKDCKALFLIHQCVDDANFEKIAGAKSSKEAWDILQQSYEGAAKVKQVKLHSLRRQFELMCMKDQETISEYFNRMQVLVNSMKACQDVISNQQIVEKILRTLTPKFDYIIVAIEESKDVSKMKVEDLLCSLEAHEQRLLDRNGARVQEQALQARTHPSTNGSKSKFKKGKQKWREGKAENPGKKQFKNSEHKHGESSNYKGSKSYHDKGEKKKFDKKNIQCYNCSKWGHFASECRSGKGRQKSDDDEAYHAKEDGSDSDEVMLMVTTSSDIDNSETWFLDTGCSNHMTGHRDWLIDFDDSVKSKVKFADNSIISAEGIGKVMITRNKGKPAYVTNVLYVPSMKTNLLSLGQLLEKGFSMNLKDNFIDVFDAKGRKVLKAPLCKNRTFQVNLNATEVECFSSTSAIGENWLWHQRYGHLNFKSLTQLAAKQMVIGLPLLQSPKQLCERCLTSKQPRNSFKSYGPARAKQSLQVVHSDVCGPMEESTLGGNKYFLSFVDEFTRKIWVYLLKEKKDVFSLFEKFCNMAERHSGNLVKILRTDGGGEFNSKEFDDYCNKKGIEHEVTAPYTPQHNGLAERRNRTLVDMARCMLKGKGMPKSYWGEAVSTAAYLLNRCPTKRMHNVTPEEAWSGHKPSVNHLKIFGSLCHRHIPDERRKKLDDKSEALVLVGYHPTGAYKLYHPDEKRVVISRDVIIDETATWKWHDQHTTSGSGTIFQPLDDVADPDTVVATNPAPVPAQPERRSQRTRFPSSRLADFQVDADDAITADGDLVHMAFLADIEPVNWQEALKEPVWQEAMKEELSAIERNQTWELVNLPAAKHPISVKWVFKVKRQPDGSIVKHKARLVARGFLQKEGVDYTEVYAPVARMETIRLVIALASSRNWPLCQMDVKSAFLNGRLDEEVYVLQPPGFEMRGQEQKVYRLHKALYGLKQAPRAWNKRVDTFLQQQGFSKCSVEFGIYVWYPNQADMIVVCLYVDDLLVTGSNQSIIERFKGSMRSEFEMTDLGTLNYFLGLEFQYSSQGIVLHQRRYVQEVLRRFNMENCKEVATPIETNAKLSLDEEGISVDGTLYKQIVGSLRFICNSRPDISYGVGLISRFMSNPKASHLVAAKRVLRYLKGTQNYGILFPRGRSSSETEIEAFSDSDWSGDTVERKSTSGYFFRIMKAPISWSSKKQNVVALSSCEAEYIAASQAACQVLWLEAMLEELKIEYKKPVKLNVDNKSSISLTKNPIGHGRSKHIETKFHFIRDQVSKGKIEVVYCQTEKQAADVLTKALKTDRFIELRKMLGVVALELVN